MDKSQTAFFKDLLTTWLGELLNNADNTVGSLLQLETDIGDITDRASLETDRSTLLIIRYRESLLINKIRRSLEDIENDEYGICEECGKGRTMGRLKARPIERKILPGKPPRILRCNAVKGDLRK